MTESKGWNWEMVTAVSESCDYWRNPGVESYYLVNRWKSQGKIDFLDLGCGLGRHSVLFGKNGFRVSCFDISNEAIGETCKWAESENLCFDYSVGDMLSLPYDGESFDCILCRNVISHTDTDGVRTAIGEIGRVLKLGGECYLTLGSKDTWGFKQAAWPMIDENTRLCMKEGPEFKVPHFYADYDLIKELFSGFEMINIHQEIDYFGDGYSSYHYHILVRKI